MRTTTGYFVHVGRIPNLFRGDVRISTNYNTSKVYINIGTMEFKDFEKRISHDRSFLGQTCIVKNSGKNSNNEFDDIIVKSIDDLFCLENGFFWIFGNIESVECHYGECYYYMACKRCVKKVVKIDNIYNCDRCKKNDDWVMPRFRFVVHVVDGRRVAEVIASENKVQLRNDIEFRINHPITVNKVCNVTEVVNKFVPLNLEVQDSKVVVGLKELCFGSDLTDIEDFTFVTAISSTLTKDFEAAFILECSAKKCLDEDFSSCDEGVLKKNKSNISVEDFGNSQDGGFAVDLKI
ncbi:hypothetical protein AAHA92_12617 [Salvia divinorum]|uniref:Replication factor A C-terminal domain-containing protein n=1 Tax=Salvia divinorum TaxID=28513 RepID=A0ABD1HKU3_SALDI